MTLKELFTYRTFTVSNLLSLMRVFLTPLIYYLASEIKTDYWNKYYLLGVVLFMILTDFLDGFMARLLKQETPLGQYLDPIADKIAMITGLFVLVRFFDYPLWVVIFVVIREVVGTWGGMYLLIRKNILGKPNYWGKWGVTAFAISSVFYVLDWPFKNYTPYVVFLVFAGGVAAYAKTYWKTVFGSSDKNNEA